MSPEEYKWQVELVQSRYPALQLTFEQAEAVLQFEQDKDFRAADDFSRWEELDFAYDTFQRILSPRQFRRYQARHEDEVQALQQQLAQLDALAAQHIPAVQRQLAFYREELIPALYRAPLLFPFTSPTESAKEVFVVAEYQRFLRAEKQRALSRHYRQHRRLSPQVLQAQLLRIELLGLIPSCQEFLEAADAPTRAVAQFLFEELRDQTELLYPDVLGPQEARLSAWHRAEFEARHGLPPEQVQGYVLHAADDPAARLSQWTLTLLWLGRDPAAYRQLRRPAEPGK